MVGEGHPASKEIRGDHAHTVTPDDISRVGAYTERELVVLERVGKRLLRERRPVVGSPVLVTDHEDLTGEAAGAQSLCGAEPPEPGADDECSLPSQGSNPRA